MFTIGEKVHVILRRYLETDLRHHFVGEVIDASEFTIRVRGYDFPFDEGSKYFDRREGIRTRIFSLVSATNVISVLPIEADIESVKYKGEGLSRVLTDGKTFKFIVSEFGTLR